MERLIVYYAAIVVARFSAGIVLAVAACALAVYTAAGYLPSWADFFNGLFELCSAAFLLLNLGQLRRDKYIAGVHWGPTVFYSAWGLWNMVYYPVLGQWFSFVGGFAVTAVNVVWLAHLVYYRWAGARL